MPTIINIPLPCKLEHLVGEEVISIGNAGPLSLVTPPPPSPSSLTTTTRPSSKSTSESTPIRQEEEKQERPIKVILTVGDLAFPLYKETLFGTTKDPFVYLFKPDPPAAPREADLGGESAGTIAGVSGWIRLCLPCTSAQAFPNLLPGANDALTNFFPPPSVATTDEVSTVLDENLPMLQKIRDQFEQVLIDLGYLTDSKPIASADDIAQSTRATLGSLALSVDEAAQNKITSTEKVDPDDETQVGEKTRKVFGGVESASQGVREISSTLTGALQNGVMWVGDQVGKRIPIASTTTTSQQIEANDVASKPDKQLSNWETTKVAFSTVTEGVVDGSTQLASHSSKAAQDVVVHTKGEQAGELVGQVNNTAANIAGTASDAIVQTSVVLLGGLTVKAMAEADRGDGSVVSKELEPDSQ